MQRNNPDYTYLVIYTIFLGWDLFPLDLLWDLLAFGSHLVKKKKKCVCWGWGYPKGR